MAALALLAPLWRAPLARMNGVVSLHRDGAEAVYQRAIHPIYRFIELPSHQLARRLCPRKKLTPIEARKIVEGKVA